MKISVIIPTLDESALLEQTLAAMRRCSPHELIVSDGGSRDGTREIAEKYASKVIVGPSGRAAQMNAGAAAATGDLVLFLHADSRIDRESYGKMVRVMSDKNKAGGAFSLAIESDDLALQMISAFATLRARYLNLVYGDQAIFVRTSVFREMGGFSSLPICEDLDFFRRLRKQGSVVLLEEKAYTSGRRWLSEGIVFTTCRNILIAALFLLGFPPRILGKWYMAIR